jgi:hypothetical protein
MFWRIVFWVAVVEIVLCVLPIELTGVTTMIRFLFFAETSFFLGSSRPIGPRGPNPVRFQELQMPDPENNSLD